MTVSKLPSSSKSALLCTSESLSLFFDYCFVFFFSVRFCTTVRFVRSEQNEKVQIIRKIRELYSKCYLRGENNQLRCFVFEKQTRKITAEFYKVLPVEPFINCLISCHIILT